MWTLEGHNGRKIQKICFPVLINAGKERFIDRRAKRGRSTAWQLIRIWIDMSGTEGSYKLE